MNMAMGVSVGVAGVEDEMEHLQANDDLAMGAPPISWCDCSGYGQRG